jgi:tetratricopeptide (TPR) repeat protein
MPEGGPEIPRVEELVGEGDEERDRYGRFVAVAIVITTLIGALVAFAQAGALQTHDKADQQAERYGSLALAAAQINRDKAEVQVDRLKLLTQQVRAANNASLFVNYGQATPANKLAAARWTAIAKQTETDTAAIAATQGVPYICSPSLQSHCPTANAFYSPELDPRFPTRYQEGGQWQAYDLTALRDAANEEAGTAEGQFVHYAAALTMLAVAVFLLGYSLTPQGRARYRLYATCAAGLVLVGGTWALVQALSPVSRAPDRAASAFADGRVALNTGDYPSAIADFSTAIKLRPHFVDAYVGRGEAEFDRGIPHTGSGATALPTTAGPVTVPTVAALDAAVRDDKRAATEGSASATVLLDLGKNLFYRGLLGRSPSDLKQSRNYLMRSITAFKTQSDARYVRAAAQLRIAEADLALGRSGATAEYRTAEHTLLAPNVPLEEAIAPAMTDLSLIEATRPRLASAVAAARLQLISVGDLAGTTATGKAPSGSHVVHFGAVQAQPDPGHALWTATNVGTYDPTKDVLNVQWQYRDPVHGEWAVLPELSGPVSAGGLLSYGANGIASNNASYVSNSSPATCLPPGMYKVDIYVDGLLAGTATTRATWPALQAVRFNDVDGAICVPSGWQPFGGGPGRDGYDEPNGSTGALILSIPKAATGGLSSNAAGLVTVMQATLQGFSGSSGVLPGISPAAKPTSTQFFMSTGNGQSQQWNYKHGYVLSGIGTSTDGQIYVGITWGPTTQLAEDLFLSLSPL